MWSLQRKETVSFDLTSKRMCLLFSWAACPAAPRGARVFKTELVGERALFLRAELWKKEGKHFQQGCKIPVLSFRSPLQIFVQYWELQVCFNIFIFLFQSIGHCPCDNIYPILKNAKNFLSIEPQGYCCHCWIYYFITSQGWSLVFLVDGPSEWHQVSSVSWNDAGAI